MVLGHPQWSRYQDVTIVIREVLPNAGTSPQSGGGTGTQQGNVILRRQVVAAPVDLTTNTGTDPSGFVPTEFIFGAVPKTGVIIWDAGIDVGRLLTLPSLISQGMIDDVGYVANADWGWHQPDDRVPCIMMQTELGSSPHEPVIYHPQPEGDYRGDNRGASICASLLPERVGLGQYHGSQLLRLVGRYRRIQLAAFLVRI